MINKAIGLDYCDKHPLIYKKILNMFVTLREKKQNSMAAAMAQEDWGTYVTLVHGLKSNVRHIGGSVLDEKALALELAGKKYLEETTSPEEKQQQLDFIRANHQEAMELYNQLAEEASQLAQSLD